LGAVENTFGAITLPAEVMVSTKLVLGQVAGNPLPDRTTLPPFKDKVDGVTAETQVETLSCKLLV